MLMQSSRRGQLRDTVIFNTSEHTVTLQSRDPACAPHISNNPRGGGKGGPLGAPTNQTSSLGEVDTVFWRRPAQRVQHAFVAVRLRPFSCVAPPKVRPWASGACTWVGGCPPCVVIRSIRGLLFVQVDDRGILFTLPAALFRTRTHQLMTSALPSAIFKD